jgi:hypothetical protein
MIAFTPNATGLANLTSWLESVLREPQHAADWANSLIEQADGSGPSVSVEISGLKTRRGAPATYRFGDDELDAVPCE